MAGRPKSTFASDRMTLVQDVHRAGREATARSVMFYTMIAQQLGLSVSDLRAWDLLFRYGPMTAGDFSNVTGLSPGAVTFLIERLARAKAVTRERDPDDGRKVVITVTPGVRLGEESPEFDFVRRSIDRLFKTYSDAELNAVLRYCRDIAGILHEGTIRLRSVADRRPARAAPSNRRKITRA